MNPITQIIVTSTGRVFFSIVWLYTAVQRYVKCEGILIFYRSNLIQIAKLAEQKTGTYERRSTILFG